MSVTQGIDCAVPLTAASARALAAKGYRFAGRYLVPSRYAWKRLTRKEAEAITQAGMRIVSVYETTARRPAGGAGAGQADGAEAYREARTVGQPAGTAIYFAVDYDAQPSDFDEIEAYLRAAAGKLPGYATGVYGSASVVEEMARRGACSHFWQTYAWSRGKKSAHANIYQYRNDIRVSGVALDENESYGGEGWWRLGAASDSVPDGAEGSGPPIGSPEGEVTMSAEDARKIIAFLQAAWQVAKTKTDRDEFHRLANEIRKAAGMPEE